MSDDIRNKALDDSEAEEMTVTVSLDDGDVVCAVITIFEVEGRDYMIVPTKATSK
ncbi:MAG: hypothetical protein IJS12_06200 [Lachnospiraceae bacterium]|nr:hypothetical protein [Lachnospiraceae bacterium]